MNYIITLDNQNEMDKTLETLNAPLLTKAGDVFVHNAPLLVKTGRVSVRKGATLNKGAKK